MGLLHWWPLNGNLDDIGLKSAPLPSSGTSSNSSGKIGSCYKITSALKINNAINELNYANTSVSFGGWFKFNQSEIASVLTSSIVNSTATTPTGNLIGNNSYGGFGLVWESNNIYSSGSFSSIRFYPYLRKSSQSIYATPSAYTVNFDTWYHFMVVLDIVNKKILFYVNGSLHSSTTYSTAIEYESHEYYINQAWVGGGNGPGKSIPLYANDIRMYDHALSAKEVKELSKGLVLHYDFEDEEIEPTTNILASPVTLAGHGSSWAQLDETFNGCPVYRNVVTSPNTGNNAGFRYNSGTISSIPTAGTKITISFWKRLNAVYGKNLGGYIRFNTSGGNKTYYWSYNKSNWANDSSSIGKWEKVIGYVTVDTTATSFNAFYVYVDNATGGNCDFSQIQVEYKDHATPYVNGTRSGEKVYDSSGYGHNGIVSGNLQISSDSMSGQYSSVYDGSSIYVEAPGPYLNGIDAYTISIWCKPATTSLLGLFSLEYSTTWRASASTSGNYVRLRDNTGDSAYKEISMGSYTANEWALYTLTYNKGTAVSYKNGVQVATVNVGGTALNTNQNWLSFGKNHQNSCWYNGKIGDIKIFATALSIDDVKAEYQRKAAIDKNGNLFTGKIIENGNSQELLWTHAASDAIIASSGTDTDGSILFKNHIWAYSPKIPVTAGETLYYDITYSNTSGSHFYVGFEFYNADGGSNQNNGCTYKIDATAAKDHARAKGSFTVPAQANSATTTHTKLRVLNDWDTNGSDSRIAKIHHISLRRVKSISSPQIDKNNYIIANDFREYNYNNNASLYKDGFVGANDIKEL